jgi:hypothetical protein
VFDGVEEGGKKGGAGLADNERCWVCLVSENIGEKFGGERRCECDWCCWHSRMVQSVIKALIRPALSSWRLSR